MENKGHDTNLYLKNEFFSPDILRSGFCLHKQEGIKQNIYNTKVTKTNQIIYEWLNILPITCEHWFPEKWVFQKGHPAVYSPTVL